MSRKQSQVFLKFSKVLGVSPPTLIEMHIFQCVNVRSRDVVEDLKHFMSGASKRGGGRGGGRHTPDYPEIKMGDLSPYEESLERVQEPRLQVRIVFIYNTF